MQKILIRGFLGLLLVLLLLQAVEWIWLGSVSSSRSFEWTPPESSALREDTELGFRSLSVADWKIPKTGRARATRTLVLMDADVLRGPEKRDRRLEQLLLERSGKRKLLPLYIAQPRMRHENTAQRVRFLELHPELLEGETWVVLGIRLLDLSRNSGLDASGYPYFVARGDPLAGESRFLLPKGWKAILHPAPRSFLARIPLLRLLAESPVRSVLSAKAGELPASLWALRRKGVQEEAKCYEGTRLAFRRFAALLRDKPQCKGVVLYLPAPAEWRTESYSDLIKKLGIGPRILESARARRYVRDLAKRESLPFVDPTRTLGLASRSLKKLIPDDCRPMDAKYTERGQKLILGRIAQELLRL